MSSLPSATFLRRKATRVLLFLQILDVCSEPLLLRGEAYRALLLLLDATLHVVEDLLQLLLLGSQLDSHLGSEKEAMPQTFHFTYKDDCMTK